LEGEAKFSSQRIASPARIFFDLKETKLASTLVGKSFRRGRRLLEESPRFTVRSRVARRVVLDVENLSEYDAFLLPESLPADH
jgi:N-acetylmuramoyl-L-alanine amidase